MGKRDRFSGGEGCDLRCVIDRADLDRLRQGLRLAGVPDQLSEGEFAAHNKLNDAEIRLLVIGHRLHGRSIFTGEERSAAVTADGIAEASGEWVSGGPLSGGAVRIENDELCYKFGVVRFCGPVLRNPGGTRSMENEFIWETGSPFTFSQIE